MEYKSAVFWTFWKVRCLLIVCFYGIKIYGGYFRCKWLFLMENSLLFSKKRVISQQYFGNRTECWSNCTFLTTNLNEITDNFLCLFYSPIWRLYAFRSFVSLLRINSWWTYPSSFGENRSDFILITADVAEADHDA